MKAPTLTTLLTAFVCIGASLLAGCGLAADGRESGRGPLVGHKAPAFHVHGVFHETYSLETFKGHILVMQFGASW